MTTRPTVHLVPFVPAYFARVAPSEDPWRCAECKRTVAVNGYGEREALPADWYLAPVPCGDEPWCPACVAGYGGSLNAIRLCCDERHAARGGCPTCNAPLPVPRKVN